jgi:hypothetical protein
VTTPVGEAAAILDVCRTRKLLHESRLDLGRDLLARTAALLTKMILACANRPRA